MSQPLLSMEGVSKAYSADAQILRDVTFKQGSNEFLAIVGPSGCGKTTMLRCISALMSPDSGSVFHEGQSFDDPPPWLSIVFQDYNRSLFPWLSVRRNVEQGLRDVARSERDDRVSEALTAVKLDHAADLYPWQLSGGMQQRCALARSIVTAPRLLLLDEPFASVDAQTRIDLQDLVMDICERMSLSALLVTHDIDEAVFMADKVVVLSTRPATVVEEIPIDLPRPRDQLTTKETPEFLSLRHKVYTLVRQQAQ
ncbi:ABC transporter ATP-binding protein [Pseudohoeflea suaedae]|uniref:ABC transporter ATP-binding protein n=1 Tax=Pseudohoeflea suaedae TaxID=877384 RepID=A0A4R5PP46_9HYPH|nr:ABC transporter ATP-binding protein [Pseudohoeflea suaedae]TDH38421.1 ABC transporter ATP-binding protein [Pseudohoeflea suaedae]